MKPRCLVVWESVEENYAVIHFYLSLHLFLSRWPKTKDGVVGEVQRVDVLRQKVKLIVEDENGDKEIQEYKIDDLLMRKKKPQGCQGCSKGCNNKNQGCNKGHGKRKN